MIKHIDIILRLKDVFDYNEFVESCKETPLLSIGEYSQKIGMLKVAMQQYTNLSPIDAYMQLIQDINKAAEVIEKPKPCGSCGSKPVNNGGIIL